MLTQGLVAHIDEEDADLLQHRWWASGTGHGHVYAQRSVPRLHTAAKVRAGKKFLHREIAERIHGPIPKGHVADHIDGDTMNNRRQNLRVVPHTVNTWNQHRASRTSKSGIIGVRLHRGRWQAYICEGRKMRVLGTFDTADEARAARLRAEADRMAAVAA